MQDFLRRYPPSSSWHQSVDAYDLKEKVTDFFNVAIPEQLLNFWQTCGIGYFGKREIYVFGPPNSVTIRDDIISWNENDIFKSVFPSPERGGPLFFAETCYGEQIGFQWNNNRCLATLFIMDTFESCLLAEDFNELFEVTLSDEDFLKRDFLDELEKHVGVLQDGLWYAPIVLPLIGGSNSPSNYRIIAPKIHTIITLKLAVSLYQSN